MRDPLKVGKRKVTRCKREVLAAVVGWIRYQASLGTQRRP
jgi:hypothetical protein